MLLDNWQKNIFYRNPPLLIGIWFYPSPLSLFEKIFQHLCVDGWSQYAELKQHLRRSSTLDKPAKLVLRNSQFRPFDHVSYCLQPEKNIPDHANKLALIFFCLVGISSTVLIKEYQQKHILWNSTQKHGDICNRL